MSGQEIKEVSNLMGEGMAKLFVWDSLCKVHCAPYSKVSQKKEGKRKSVWGFPILT